MKLKENYHHLFLCHALFTEKMEYYGHHLESFNLNCFIFTIVFGHKLGNVSAYIIRDGWKINGIVISTLISSCSWFFYSTSSSSTYSDVN